MGCQKENYFWREVLKRLVKITLRLACHGQSFRGHQERICVIYNGNFLSEVELHAEFDRIMNYLINKHNHSIKYLSPLFQNELIAALSEHLENEITEEIKSALSAYQLVFHQNLWAEIFGSQAQILAQAVDILRGNIDCHRRLKKSYFKQHENKFKVLTLYCVLR